MSDPELESFKTRIDLRAYAASLGYAIDGRKSSRGSTVMRHANGDKIIISRKPDGQYTYWSPHDDKDHGTILDLLKNRTGMNLGQIRKRLREWTGTEAPARPAMPELQSTPKDRAAVQSRYASMRVADRHPYLENERSIPAELLQHQRFAGRIRIDARGNAILPHLDRQGLCGYEIKNSGFTGFASGGTKGLWSSHQRPDDCRLVFCEGAIDALSYAVLFPDDRTRYASIGGQLNPVQRELIRAASANMPMNSQIVAAMDADPAGAKLAEVVRAAVELSGRDDLCFIFQEPVGFKDWNEALQAGRRPSLGSSSRLEARPA